MKAAIFFLLWTCAALPYQPQGPEELVGVDIRDKISRLALALDQKDFGALSEVFTPDAVANLGPPDDHVEGLPAIQNILRERLADHVTQHTFSTTAVDFIDKRSPNSTAYVVPNYFGQGNLTGQILSFYAKHLDSWVYQDGSWKIKSKQVILFPPGVIGNQAILGAPSK